MNQDASSLHKEMLASVPDMEADDDAMNQVALRSLAGTPTDVKNTVE
jgi:hypothetical protein